VAGVGFLREAVECASRGPGRSAIPPRRAGALACDPGPHAQAAQGHVPQEAAGAIRAYAGTQDPAGAEASTNR